jgi:hypothetical protein
LASVSDSKAKLVKALFQEWEIKHASCTLCPKTADKEVSVKDEKDKEQAISDASDVQKKSKEESESKKVANTPFRLVGVGDYSPPDESSSDESSSDESSSDESDPKTSSNKSSSERNFNLPERVASPVTPEGTKSNKRKLWNKWSTLGRNKDSGEVERRFPLEGSNPKTGQPYDAFDKNRLKLGILDQAIGGSVGRADDPEVAKQITPGSTFWIDPNGLYGPDKQRKGNSLKGRKGEDAPDAIDSSKIVSMVGTALGRSSLGNEGVLHTYHKCTGNTFRGFNTSDNSFAQCQHEHHEGDGCGLSSEVAAEGSMQPGCGQHHILTKVQSHSFVSIPSGDGTSRVGAVPHMEDEQQKDISGLHPAEQQQHMNRLKNSGPTAGDYTNPTEEQVGEVPPSRMFLMHPDQSARWAAGLDENHAKSGGEGRHPANLEEFKIGDKTHRVGDIVSTVRRWGSSEPRTEGNLGLVVGASSHRNGEHVRFGRSEGLAPNTESDSSSNASTPGEYSLMVHRIDDPSTGSNKPTAIDPGSGSILPNHPNETTLYYPNSDVDTVARPTKKVNTTSKLYDTLKSVQSKFKAKPDAVRTERPKTVKPTRDNLDLSTLDLGSLFGDSDE